MTEDHLPDTALELRSLVTSRGTLELSLRDVPVPTPAGNEVLVRVEAAPINPSDLGLLIASADMATAEISGTPQRPTVTATIDQTAGAETIGRLRARVAAELTTTFASTYTREVSLAGMLGADAFNAYLKRATGEKFLVTPQAAS